MAWDTIILVFFTFLGAFILYILNRTQNKQPFSLFAAINIDIGNSASPICILLDMAISSMIGSIVVFALTSPSTIAQSIIAGLGMTGILSTHTKDLGE